MHDFLCTIICKICCVPYLFRHAIIVWIFFCVSTPLLTYGEINFLCELVKRSLEYGINVIIFNGCLALMFNYILKFCERGLWDIFLNDFEKEFIWLWGLFDSVEFGSFSEAKLLKTVWNNENLGKFIIFALSGWKTVLSKRIFKNSQFFF